MLALGFDLEGFERGKRHAARVLAGFVAGSIAVHAALILVLPGMRAQVPDRTGPLEVTLEEHEVPRPMPLRRQPEPEKRVERRELRKSEREIERPVRRPDTQQLVLPAQPAVPEPSFAVAVPEPRAAPEPSAPAREAAQAAAASKQEGASEKISPPSFSAAYLKNAEPPYPLSARRNGEQGTVLLRVQVTREGRAATVSLEKSSGFAALDRSALDAVKGWRFVPARQGGTAIEAPVLVPIVYALKDR